MGVHLPLNVVVNQWKELSLIIILNRKKNEYKKKQKYEKN